MEKLLKILFSPMAFAVGFLWPLTAQSLIALGMMAGGVDTWLLAAIIVLPFALIAQFRGSWIWLRS